MSAAYTEEPIIMTYSRIVTPPRSSQVTQNGILVIIFLLAVFSQNLLADKNSFKGNAMQDLSAVLLNAESRIENDALHIHYAIKNGSPTDIYVLNAFAASHPESKQAYVATDRYTLYFQQPDQAVILIGIPPLPEDRLVAIRVMPLAVKLAAGATLSWDMPAIPLPLIEKSAYAYAADTEILRTITINSLLLHVQFISALAEGFQAQPVAYDAKYFSVRSQQTVADAHELTAVLSYKGMVLKLLP
jgi:hypothetical protein